ncbi:MAG TPA: LOG family protein [Anaerolineae bacterium]|nr:LOG family protein [Anaerolineae bacterium]
MPHTQGVLVAVYGSNAPKPDEADYEQARRLGRLLAQAGYVVATGGYGGTMEGASRGAQEAGGHVIGVTTSIFDAVRLSCNPYVAEEIKFPTLFQRLHYLVTCADAWVALPGGIGTLSEVALTWSLMQVGEIERKPFVLVGAMWRQALHTFAHNGYVQAHQHELLAYAETVEEVTALLKRET